MLHAEPPKSRAIEKVEKQGNYLVLYSEGENKKMEMSARDISIFKIIQTQLLHQQIP